MRIGENARIFFSEREKSVPAMRVTTLVNKLIGLQGLWVRGFHFQADKARVVVDVVPRRRKPLCGICGRKVRKNKDRYNRYWRHLDLFGVRTYLRYSIRRVVCRRCGVVREKVPWADKGSRFTKSFEQEVAWLAQRTDVSAVANYFRVTWRVEEFVAIRSAFRPLTRTRRPALLMMRKRMVRMVCSRWVHVRFREMPFVSAMVSS